MATKKQKVIVRDIALNNGTLSSVGSNNNFPPGYSSFTLNHILYPTQRANMALVLTAIFGKDYDSDNVGTFDADNRNIYPANVYKIDDETIAICFGDYKEGSNNAKIALNEDGDFEVLGHQPKFITQTEKVPIGDKVIETKVPYLLFEIDVEVPAETEDGDPAINRVSYKMPFRVEKQSDKQTEALQQAWLNGEMSEITSILLKPSSGGGGWITIAAISNTFVQAKMNLFKMDFKVTDFKLEPGNEYGDNIDIFVDPEYVLPLVIAKNNFVTVNATKIRVASNHTAFGQLLPLINDPELKTEMMAGGCYLQILGFNLRDKLNYPRHSIIFGNDYDLPKFPDFSEILSLNGQNTQGALAGANEFAIPVNATTVPATIPTKVDKADFADMKAMDAF